MIDMLTSQYRFVRFRELSPEAINVDLQVHTRWTDGKGTIQEVLELAQARNIKTIAFTEHVRKETLWYGEFIEEVTKFSRHYPNLNVLVGCEAKVLNTDGDFDVSNNILNSSDIVLGSVHRFPNGLNGYLDFEMLDSEAMAWIECELAVALARYAPIHVLSHPGGMYQRHTGNAYPELFYRRIISAALRRNVAVEINSSYLIEPDVFLQLCEELNPYVSIGSDVHNLEDLGHCRDLLMDWFGW